MGSSREARLAGYMPERMPTPAPSSVAATIDHGATRAGSGDRAAIVCESATLSTLGALFGILLGIAISQGIAAASPLPARVAPWSIVAATLLGAGVGIIAGMYPASRASRLDPIAALRQE